MEHLYGGTSDSKDIRMISDFGAEWYDRRVTKVQEYLDLVSRMDTTMELYRG